MTIPYRAILKYAVPPLLVLGVAVYLYFSGYNNGVKAIESKREADRHAQELVIANLHGQITQRESRHKSETQAHANELEALEISYAQRLADVRNSASVSLRDSEQRASRYRTIAEAGASQCSALASYAAELDRSIVEGRQVVAGLAATLEQRDHQLRLLGEQLKSDRRLLENYENSSSTTR